MKNPWMKMWLSTLNSSLEATRVFWARMLRQPAAEERDRTSDASEAAAAEAAKATAPPPPDDAKPKTDASEQPGAKTQRKASERASDSRSAAPASEAKSESQRPRAAEPSKSEAENRGGSRKNSRSTSSAAKKADASKPKYRNPDDPSQTWSGRGRRPRWVVQSLEAGRTLDDLQAGKR